MIKDPKKVEAGKRWAEWNHKKREELKVQKSKREQLEPSQYYGTGAIVVTGALGILGYCVYHYKKTPKETLVHQTNETMVHQPKDHKFEME